ncbi:MAG: hypothetical protein A3H94_01545 [Acidobacteria bacterium RIFCSPLOWO2_02_FULL_60_20]|nr:MAG: hypothetical protein A3H94_01545 [Acidobacteria bacterium RIFCSPLOWO2_02_FULL_60_20]
MSDKRLRFGSFIEQRLTYSRENNAWFFLRTGCDHRSTAARPVRSNCSALEQNSVVRQKGRVVCKSWFAKPRWQVFKTGEKGWGRWDCLGENIVLGGLEWNRTGVYSQPSEGQEIDTGPKLKVQIPVR